MKKNLIILIVLIISTSLKAQDISGTWQGVLYQQSGTPVSYFPFSMTLSQNGNNLSGTSEIRSSDNSNHFAVITLTGSISDTTFQFEEITIIDEQTNGAFFWCVKNGKLEYDSNQQKLEGNWQAPSCNPGSIEIYQSLVISNTVFCSNELIQLEVTGQNITWYSDKELTDSLHTGNTYSPTITTTTTFYVTQRHYNTESPAIPITVTINSAPIINDIVSSQNGCNSQNGLISVDASGGTGLLEYSIDKVNFQVSNHFENLESGIYSVIARDSLGCEDIQSDISVTSNPLPSTSISGNLEICEGENTVLEASGEGSFLWDNGNSTNTIIVNSTNTYSVTLTDDFGCEAYDSVHLIVSPLPIVNLDLPRDTFCIDEMNLELSGGFPLGGTYLENGAEINLINPNILGEGIHLISYIYTDQNGCTNSSSQEILVEDINCTTFTEEVEVFSEIEIYPNPTSEFLSILINGENTANCHINIYNTDGQLVLSKKHSTKPIEITNLTKGIYLIHLLIEERIYTKKVIFQ